MQTWVNFCLKFKWILLSVGLLVLALLVTHVVSESALNGWMDHLNAINHRMEHHHVLMGMVHALILVSVYFLWGMKVEYEAKKHHLTPATVKKAKRFRYFLIFFILFVDYLTFLH